jgi:hypothetical protein
MRKTAIVLTLVLLAAAAPQAQANYLFNKDACQSFVAPQNNFEICLPGNTTAFSTIVAPTIQPAGWSFAGKSYNAATNTTCYSFIGPALPQQPPTGTPYHFGINYGDYTGGEFREANEYWTQSTKPSPLPGGACNFNYANGTLTVTVSNDTDAATSINQVGVLIFSSPQPLAAMTASQMPPSSFPSSGIPTGTVLNPGEQVSFTVDKVAATASVVCFQSIQVANPPSPPAPPCSQAVHSVRQWAQAAVAELQPPGTVASSQGAPAVRSTKAGAGRNDSH